MQAGEAQGRGREGTTGRWSGVFKGRCWHMKRRYGRRRSARAASRVWRCAPDLAEPTATSPEWGSSSTFIRVSYPSSTHHGSWICFFFSFVSGRLAQRRALPAPLASACPERLTTGSRCLPSPSRCRPHASTPPSSLPFQRSAQALPRLPQSADLARILPLPLCLPVTAPTHPDQYSPLRNRQWHCPRRPSQRNPFSQASRAYPPSPTQPPAARATSAVTVRRAIPPPDQKIANRTNSPKRKITLAHP